MYPVPQPSKIEYGDFQTPASLANTVCQKVARRQRTVRSIVEPTCGIGNFIAAAQNCYPRVSAIVAAEINNSYMSTARDRLKKGVRAQLFTESFFSIDWERVIASLPEPILVIGNPPWVTNSTLGSLQSSNLPDKTNASVTPGIDAVTGKSNFDISESILLKLVTLLSGRAATLAMLCKTSVARKVLTKAWNSRAHIGRAEAYAIDAKAHFGANVDACLLIVSFDPNVTTARCDLFDSLESTTPTKTISSVDGRLIADTNAYERSSHLICNNSALWRSGIKHDCARVMELRADNSYYINGFGDHVRLEPTFLFPMLKSSELVHNRKPSRVMVVTQRHPGDDTNVIKTKAPMTWAYLNKYEDAFSRRKSSIYLRKPKFSIFGVGAYTFSSWKVAISGLYKTLEFRTVGPHAERPVVFDDTVYLLPLGDRKLAEHVSRLLQSRSAAHFFQSFIFWDAKRPVTAELLNTLDLAKIEAIESKQNLFRLWSQQKNNRGAK